MTRLLLSRVVLALATLVAAPVSAQLNSENLLGDTGVKNGSQPAPGISTGFRYYRIGTDTIKDQDANRLTLDPSQRGSETLHAVTPVFIYVSTTKVLGANYGKMAVTLFADGALEAPGYGFDAELSTGPADLYLDPAWLGDQAREADIALVRWAHWRVYGGRRSRDTET